MKKNIQIKNKLNKILQKIKIKAEYIFISMIIAIFVTSLIFNIPIFNLPIPEILILKFNNTDNLHLDIFQIQATISTLSISIVALISGMISKSYYGILVIEYFLSIEPKYLKFRTVIIGLFISIFINYIFVAFNLLNLSVSLFAITIILLIWLIWCVVSVFINHDEIHREKIKEFIIKEIKACSNDLNKYRYYFNKIKKEVNSALNKKDKNVLLDNLEIMKKIIELKLNDNVQDEADGECLYGK